MVSRIRIDLFGRTAAEVEQQAASFYNWLVPRPANTNTTFTVYQTVSGGDNAYPGGTYSAGGGAPFQSVGRGELVIERQLAEPEDSPFAYKGRASFHPDISTVTDAGAPPTFMEEEAA